MRTLPEHISIRGVYREACGVKATSLVDYQIASERVAGQYHSSIFSRSWSARVDIAWRTSKPIVLDRLRVLPFAWFRKIAFTGAVQARRRSGKLTEHNHLRNRRRNQFEWAKKTSQQRFLLFVQLGNGSDLGVEVATGKPLSANEAPGILLEAREFADRKSLEFPVDLSTIGRPPSQFLLDGLPLSQQCARYGKSDPVDFEGLRLCREAKCGNDECCEEQTNHGTLLTAIS